MGQYHKVKCPACQGSIEITKPEELPARCPACNASFAGVMERQGGGTGLTTPANSGLTTASAYFHLDDERTNSN